MSINSAKVSKTEEYINKKGEKFHEITMSVAEGDLYKLENKFNLKGKSTPTSLKNVSILYTSKDHANLISQWSKDSTHRQIFKKNSK